MSNTQQRLFLIKWISSSLDYWTPRRHQNKEAEEQYQHYSKMMVFLVTQMDTAKFPKPSALYFHDFGGA